MNLLGRLPHSVTGLTRIAAGVALLGLGIFTIGLLVPQPLPVIVSMSVGHALGAVAVLLYFVAIAFDSTRKGRGSIVPSIPPSSKPPTPRDSNHPSSKERPASSKPLSNTSQRH